ncbi:hypothetical protein HDU96_007076 [Phlyctochytrium bullatum]|nr:hypothetical protein HDU96_007076 [Phlyctochytrium bullatum]
MSNVELSKVPPPVSDGIRSPSDAGIPSMTIATASDLERYLAKLEPDLMVAYREDAGRLPDLPEGTTSVSFVKGAKLTALPTGYELWCQKRSGSTHVDKYLYGHPSGTRYRSVNEFRPHIVWLAKKKTDPELRCVCCICVKMPANSPRKSPATQKRRQTIAGEKVRPSSADTPPQGSQSAKKIPAQQKYKNLVPRPSADKVIDMTVNVDPAFSAAEYQKKRAQRLEADKPVVMDDESPFGTNKRKRTDPDDRSTKKAAGPSAPVKADNDLVTRARQILKAENPQEGLEDLIKNEAVKYFASTGSEPQSFGDCRQRFGGIFKLIEDEEQREELEKLLEETVLRLSINDVLRNADFKTITATGVRTGVEKKLDIQFSTSEDVERVNRLIRMCFKEMTQISHDETALELYTNDIKTIIRSIHDEAPQNGTPDGVPPPVSAEAVLKRLEVKLGLNFKPARKSLLKHIGLVADRMRNEGSPPLSPTRTSAPSTVAAGAEAAPVPEPTIPAPGAAVSPVDVPRPTEEVSADKEPAGDDARVPSLTRPAVPAVSEAGAGMSSPKKHKEPTPAPSLPGKEGATEAPPFNTETPIDSALPTLETAEPAHETAASGQSESHAAPESSVAHENAMEPEPEFQDAREGIEGEESVPGDSNIEAMDVDGPAQADATGQVGTSAHIGNVEATETANGRVDGASLAAPESEPVSLYSKESVLKPGQPKPTSSTVSSSAAVNTGSIASTSQVPNGANSAQQQNAVSVVPAKSLGASVVSEGQKAKYRVDEIVWVEVILTVKHAMNPIPIIRNNKPDKLDARILYDDIIFWPAKILKVFSVDSQTLWGTPIIVDSNKNPGQIFIGTSGFYPTDCSPKRPGYLVTLLCLSDIQFSLPEIYVTPFSAVDVPPELYIPSIDTALKEYQESPFFDSIVSAILNAFHEASLIKASRAVAYLDNSKSVTHVLLGAESLLERDILVVTPMEAGDRVEAGGKEYSLVVVESLVYENGNVQIRAYPVSVTRKNESLVVTRFSGADGSTAPIVLPTRSIVCKYYPTYADVICSACPMEKVVFATSLSL